MEPRIQYAKTEDGVDIAYWTLGEGEAIVHMPRPIASHIQLEWEDESAATLYTRVARYRMVVRYDGPAGIQDGARAMAVDASGNVYVTGFSADGTGISVTERDYLTIKYSKSAPPPAPTPPDPVGGDLRPIDPAMLPLETVDSSGSNARVLAGTAAAGAAAAITLGGAAWYGRRRWVS